MGITLGIVGYGSTGELHHKQAEKVEGVTVIGAYDIDPARQDAAKANGIRRFGSLKALLGCREINTVLISAPVSRHKELCAAAARAGKHVACAAPAALSAWDLDQIIAAVGRSDRVLAVCQSHRLDGDFCTVKKLLNTGRMGKVYSIQVRLHSCGDKYGWPDGSEDGGILFSWGIHVIDQLMWLLGYDDFTGVFCRTCSMGPAGTDDYCFLSFNLESGGVVQIELDRRSPQVSPRWTVLGNKAAAFLGGTAGEGRVIPLEPGTETGEGELLPPEPEETAGPLAAYYGNLRDVMDLSGRLSVQPWQVRRVLKAVEAALQSAETGKLVSLKG